MVSARLLPPPVSSERFPQTQSAALQSGKASVCQLILSLPAVPIQNFLSRVSGLPTLLILDPRTLSWDVGEDTDSQMDAVRPLLLARGPLAAASSLRLRGAAVPGCVRQPPICHVQLPLASRGSCTGAGVLQPPRKLELCITRESAALVDAAFSLKNSNWLPSEKRDLLRAHASETKLGAFFQVPGGAPVGPADSSYRPLRRSKVRGVPQDGVFEHRLQPANPIKQVCDPAEWRRRRRRRREAD